MPTQGCAVAFCGLACMDAAGSPIRHRMPLRRLAFCGIRGHGRGRMAVSPDKASLEAGTLCGGIKRSSGPMDITERQIYGYGGAGLWGCPLVLSQAPECANIRGGAQDGRDGRDGTNRGTFSFSARGLEGGRTRQDRGRGGEEPLKRRLHPLFSQPRRGRQKPDPRITSTDSHRLKSEARESRWG